MKTNSRMWNIGLAVAILSAVIPRPIQAQPEGATIIDSDTNFYLWPYPTISPDGDWIAYVSKGRILVSSLRNPALAKCWRFPIHIRGLSSLWKLKVSLRQVALTIFPVEPGAATRTPRTGH